MDDKGHQSSRSGTDPTSEFFNRVATGNIDSRAPVTDRGIERGVTGSFRGDYGNFDYQQQPRTNRGGYAVNPSGNASFSGAALSSFPAITPRTDFQPRSPQGNPQGTTGYQSNLPSSYEYMGKKY